MSIPQPARDAPVDPHGQSLRGAATDLERSIRIRRLATVSLILAFLALCAAVLPVAGVILGAVAVCLGIWAWRPTAGRRRSVAAVSIGAVALVLGIISTSLPGGLIAIGVTSLAQRSDSSLGSVGNPAAVNDQIQLTTLSVRINSIDPDATAKVLAESKSSMEPKSGFVYAIVNYTVTNSSSSDATDQSAQSVRIGFRSEDGTELKNLTLGPQLGEGLAGGMLRQGGSATGNVVLEIPKESPGLLTIWERGGIGDPVYVSYE